MLRNEYKQAYFTILTLCGSSFTYFLQVFLTFNYRNFDIAMSVLRWSISVQVSKKIFGITNNQGFPNMHGRIEKKFKY